VSEVPKEAPIAKKYDSRHELEEVKSTEQMKEEVCVIHKTYVFEENQILFLYHLITSNSISHESPLLL